MSKPRNPPPPSQATLAALTRQLEEAERRCQVLTEQNIGLQNAKVRAEKANLSKSDFLASMSHELRSPLNAILGFAQLMETETPAPTPSQKGSLGRILRAGWHLLNLINEVLDLAKIESGKVSLSPEPVSLGEVLVECRSMVEGQAQKGGIRMAFPVFADPCYVHADRLRLKQVLLNLLSNAIKYNREQGTVEVAYAKSLQGTLRVEIRDRGVGLAPEMLEQLFQPFNRLGQETSGEQGTGLGLVVAKKLIELMEGSIGVESTLGVGSLFWFELKSCDRPQVPPPSAHPAIPALVVADGAAPPRILLYVEDNPANLSLVEQLIARRPELRLLTAMSGKQGIELARVHQPEVILMDINLPDISGIEALGALRNDTATAHIPVVAISANAMPSDVARGMQVGFFEYLTKPIKVNEFTETLDKALGFAEKGMGRAKGGVGKT